MDSSSSLKQRRSWPNPSWIFEGDQSPKGHAGFKDWKPVHLISKPAWQIPGYSEEQYRVPLSEWQNWAQSRLALQIETAENMIQRLAKTACESISMRVEAVQEGEIVDEYSLCPIEYTQGKQMDLSEVKRRLFLGLFSNNPHDEMKYRWGDEKGSSSLTKQCRSWDPWFPDLDQN